MERKEPTPGKSGVRRLQEIWEVAGLLSSLVMAKTCSSSELVWLLLHPRLGDRKGFKAWPGAKCGALIKVSWNA